MFLRHLKEYLQTKGIGSVCLDFMPDSPDRVVGIFLARDELSSSGDGSRVCALRVRARDKSSGAAREAAQAVLELLDSGPDERVFDIGGLSAVFRPLGGPLKLKSDERGRTQCCFDLSVWREG